MRNGVPLFDAASKDAESEIGRVSNRGLMVSSPFGMSAVQGATWSV